MDVRKTQKVTLALLLVLISCSPSFAIFGRRRSNCSYCYTPHVVAAVPVYSITVYQTSIDLEIEAAVEKKFRELGLSPGWNGNSQQKPQPTSTAPAPGGVLKAKCGSCHANANARGGGSWDMSQPLSADTAWLITEMLGGGINVPESMKTVIPSVTDSEKASILQEMIQLRQQAKAATTGEIPPVITENQGKRRYDEKKRKWYILDGKGNWIPEYVSPYVGI